MTLYAPSGLTPDAMISLASKSYGSDLLITGVPTNADGEPVWSSLDDLIGHPHAHGLFSCLESIAHVHQWVSMTADEFRPALPRLAPRFVATIDEAIDGSADTWNPAAWIHLGHGELEHTLKRIEGLDEWEDEEYEHIPGLSNGHEDQDYRAFRNLPVAFQRNRAIFSSLLAAVLRQADCASSLRNRSHSPCQRINGFPSPRWTPILRWCKSFRTVATILDDMEFMGV